MKPYEFTRIYHPRLGKFVYRHKGSGIIVDNIFKPLKNISTSIFKRSAKKAGEKVGKKLGEKVGKKLGEKVGKKISKSKEPSSGLREKSGDVIMKKLAKMRKGTSNEKKKEEESTDMILNRLISGSGIKVRKI